MFKRCTIILALVLVLVIGLLPVTARAGGSSDGLEYMICENHVEITGYSGRAKEVVIPATYAGLPVTSINENAFYGCDSMTSISIPDGITHIGKKAFSYCTKLTSISIPRGVTYIGDYAFYRCNSLASISIPKGVASIGDYTFFECDNLTSVSIPDGVTYIGDYAFSYCKSLSSISIPKGVTSIGGNAFYHCSSLTSISIPDSVTSIGGSAFSGCKSLPSLSIPKGVTSIGDYTFFECDNLTSISIPDSVTSIGDCAFFGCKSLTSLSIPKGVTSIEYQAFCECDSLTSVIIPDSVTYIGYGAFAHCDKLASIYFEGNAPEFANSVFSGVTAYAYYPFGCPTWTVLKGYGGSISWVPYTPNPFADVPADSYYYDPVLWAVEQGITDGTSDTTFSPDDQCLRSQVVTFLHRAAKNPAPSSNRNPFSDVKAGDYFYQPVLWAVEKGITDGVADDLFGSKNVCTRGQVVTFLWRAAGEPKPRSSTNPFEDVNPTDYFYSPVLWALENGITDGTSDTTFAPNATCTRAQVVTFLYRAEN